MNMQELMRMVAEQVANGVIDAEAELLCAKAGAPRNGYRLRTPKTCLGDLALRVPKVRIGSLFPSGVIERYQRVDRALAAAATVTSMYHVACNMLREICPRAAAVLEEAEPDALAYLDLPPSHWKRPRTNNVQERPTAR